MLRPLAPVLGLLLAASADSERRASSATGADVAFVHVAVVPMDAPRVLADQTVLVKGTRIVAVGPAGQTPASARVTIDGRGKFLMPGLADMHAHLNDKPALTLLLANGVTTVRNMWGSRLQLDWRAAIEKGDLPGPTIHTAGPILDGAPPIWDGSTPVADAAEAERAVQAQKASGYEFVKVYSGLTPEAYQAIVKAAAEAGMPVAGHVPVRVGLESALEARQRSIEHLDGYLMAAQRDDSPVKGKLDFPSRRRAIEFVDDAKLEALVRRTREAGTWNCPTLVVYAKFLSPADGAAERARPEMSYVSPLVVASWDPSQDFRSKDMTAADYALLRRGDARRAQLVKQLHDAGARLLLGTDFPNPFVVPGFAIHEELSRLVAAGLTPYEAIRAGTADAAEYLGDDFGLVAAGRRADLILIEGNPLEDVKNVARRSGVMARGAWHPESELRERLDALARGWDAGADRLAKLPPLGQEGTRLVEARSFRALYNGVFAGQERFAVDRLDGGRRVLFAHSVYDEAEPASATSLVREELDASGKLARIDIRKNGWSGAITLRAEVVGGRLIGRAEVEGGVAVPIDEAAGDTLFLPGPLGAWQLVSDRAHALAVGGQLTLAGRDVDADPAVHLVEVTARVTRLPDEEGARRYAVQEQRKNGSASTELTLDPGEVVRAAHVRLKTGEVTITAEQR